MVKNEINNPFELGVVVEKDTRMELESTFMPFFEKAKEWAEKAKQIVITSAEQKEDMLLARDARLELKNIRVDVEKTRKSLKEESLRKGKAVDGMANVIKYLIAPIEEHLQEQEDFVKIQEEKLKTEIIDKRKSELSKYDVEVEFYNLGDMSEEGYKQLLETSKIVYDNKKETERKAEEERIKQEKERVLEQERIGEENEKLKKEANEREKLAKIEREKQVKIEAGRIAEQKKQRDIYEVKLKKERAERAKIEAELKRKKETEERVEREQLAKERKEKEEKELAEKEVRLAPDKKKLERLAVTIQEIQMPEVTSKGARDILEDVVKLLNKTSNFIKQKSINL